jgi:hypothetical protein
MLYMPKLPFSPLSNSTSIKQVILKINVFWDVTSSSVVELYLHFGGTSANVHQNSPRRDSEDSNLTFTVVTTQNLTTLSKLNLHLLILV